jgi:hypothetical protein
MAKHPLVIIEAGTAQPRSICRRTALIGLSSSVRGAAPTLVQDRLGQPCAIDRAPTPPSQAVQQTDTGLNGLIPCAPRDASVSAHGAMLDFLPARVNGIGGKFVGK